MNKEAIKNIKLQMKRKNNFVPREMFLALAYLRGIPYRVLEKKINEDHPSFGESGRLGFWSGLSHSVAIEISRARSGDYTTQGYLVPVDKEERNSIYNWMQVSEAKEEAA